MLRELNPKRLELLSETVPQAGVIGLLVNLMDVNTELVIGDVQEAARAKGRQLHVVKASTEDGINAAFATLGQLHAGALLVSSDPFLNRQREQVITLVVPAIYFERGFAAAGGLMSYGSSLTATYRELGIYTAKILKGAKPADLPVEQPTKFELVINLKTAKALGLPVPPSTSPAPTR